MSDRSSAPRSRRSLLPAALAVLLLVATACSFGGSQEPTGATFSSQAREVQLRVDGRERSYLLKPAEGLSEGERSALVVVLHQEGGTPEGVAAETDLAGLRKRGATLAYPAGIDNSWDAGACCGTPQKTGVDDIAFLEAVLADVEKQAPVDRRRTAFVGYSSGGMLTYRYVCDRPGRLAAAVVVSGSLESPCDREITMPDVLALHGKADGTVGFEQPRFIKALGLAPRPVVSTLAILTRSAGCRTTPRTAVRPDAEERHWVGCRGGDVQAQLVPGAGHGWGKLDASRRTSEFLLTHLIDA